MAQATSDLWKELFRMRGTVREYAFEIDGTWYGPASEVAHSSERKLFEDFGIGHAVSATLTLNVITDNVPKSATIKRFVRLKNREAVSEWLQKGIFFTNRRAVDGDYWTIDAYDAMGKSDTAYLPDVVEGDWPYPMKNVVEEIAQKMGVNIDPRTVIDESYMLQYPTDSTMRQVLCEIAAAHGGNWVITDIGELYLVPLMSAPEETDYLVNETGYAITFGGVRILV